MVRLSKSNDTIKNNISVSTSQSSIGKCNFVGVFEFSKILKQIPSIKKHFKGISHFIIDLKMGEAQVDTLHLIKLHKAD